MDKSLPGSLTDYDSENQSTGLQADRVVIFQFEPNSNFEQGMIIAESVLTPLLP